MSQMGSYMAGNPALPGVDTLTGNTGGAVGPDGAGNINVVGDGTITTVTGNPGANTLTVSLVNQSTFSVTTVDATATPLGPFTVPVNSSVSVIYELIGVTTDFSAVCSGVIQCAARRSGGGASIVGVPSNWNSSNSFGTASFDIVVSGNNIQLQVTGEVATIINWKATRRLITNP